MPDMMYVSFGIWGAILGGAFYFARRFVRAFERRSNNEASLSALGARLAAVEDSMESLRGDIDRLNAGQEFTTRLLTSRAELNEAIGERSAR